MVPFLLKLQFCRILNQEKQKEMLSRRNYIVLWLQQHWQVKSVHRFLKQEIQKLYQHLVKKEKAATPNKTY